MLKQVREIFESRGCFRVAQNLPLVRAELVENSLGFYVATVEASADQYCPNGVFGTGYAVDVDPEAALVRASFEVVERYCLAATGYHTQRIQQAYKSDPSVFLFHNGSSVGYEYGNEIICLEDCQASKAIISKYPVGDVFAPHPRRDGNIGGPSTTNGVGCHTDRDLAKQSAIFELYERHCIMNFWFFDQKIARVVGGTTRNSDDYNCIKIIKELGYEMMALDLSIHERFPTVMIVARNIYKHFPYCICSASSKTDIEEANISASKELLQTILSLTNSGNRFLNWASKGYHVRSLEHNMFYFANPEFSHNFDAIFDRLCNVELDEQETIRITDKEKLSIFDNVHLVDLTPPVFQDEVFVYRAISDDFFKLVVGDSSGEHRLLNSNKRINLPHPFP